MPFRELQERIAELERRMSNMLFYGVVIEAKENKVKVAQGDLVTGWIPVFQAAAGTNESIFTPIENGEMVCVVCPNGSIENGAAIRGLNYSKKKIPATSDQETVIQFKNGNTIKVDKTSKKIQSSVTGDAEISAANVTINPSTACCVHGNNEADQPVPVLTIKTKCPVFGVPIATNGSPILSADGGIA